MAIQIRVDSVQKSKSGKAWAVKSGDKWYAAQFDSGIDKCVGKVIEAITSTFGQGGEGIKSYRIIEQGGSTQAEEPIRTFPTQSAARQGGQVPIPTNGDMRWLPMASNTVNAAIAAGVIKSPSEIKPWVLAVKDAVEKIAAGDVGF